MDERILGAWTLRSMHAENTETKARTEPFGPDPRGTLILHTDGRMAALLSSREREGPGTGGPDRFLAYAGRFRLEPPDRLVTSVDISFFEAWVGTEQVRTYRLDGDTLEMVTPAARMPQPDGSEATVIGILRFTRDAPRPPG